ncbi:MAG: FlgD immunoglobulin-like domain containing protein [bacterium]
MENTPLRLTIFDSCGRKIVDLVDATLPPGLHTVEWNGEDSEGRPVASGVYFCRLSAGDRKTVIKLTLTK